MDRMVHVYEHDMCELKYIYDAHNKLVHVRVRVHMCVCRVSKNNLKDLVHIISFHIKDSIAKDSILKLNCTEVSLP